LESKSPEEQKAAENSKRKQCDKKYVNAYSRARGGKRERERDIFD